MRQAKTRAPRRWLPLAVATVIGTMTTLAQPVPATAATYGTVRTVAAPQSTGLWGLRQAATGADYNRDLVNDFIVASGDEFRVWLVSGRDGSLLRAFTPPESIESQGFGDYVAVPGDLDGDALPDLLIGAPWASTPGVLGGPAGRAFAFSGRTGALLFSLNDPTPSASSRFGSRLARAGDVNRDGVQDILVGASGTLDSGKPLGRAFIFSGNPADHLLGPSSYAPTGLIRILDLPPEDTRDDGTRAGFGLSVSSPGDVGTPPPAGSSEAGPPDGVADQVIGAGYYSPDQRNDSGRVYVFDGASGALIRKFDSPEPQGGQRNFGFHDAVYDIYPLKTGQPATRRQFDVNEDGHADIYSPSYQQTVGANEGQGKAWVFDGKTGAVIYALDDPSPGYGHQFGWSMAATNFDNRQGGIDLYIGKAPHHFAGFDENGGTYVFNGTTGALLQTLELPAGCRQPSTTLDQGPTLGWSLAAPGDLNADGLPDYVAGAPYFNQPKEAGFGGAEIVFESNTTTPSSFNCASSAPQNWSGNPSAKLAPPADFDGDGTTDPSVWRPSNNTWYAGSDAVAWGTQGDKPVPGDYNADGKTDMAQWRPSNGVWYVKGLFEQQYGQQGDIPVPADYDGDGRTDLAFFRPSNSTWYILNSSDGSESTKFFFYSDYHSRPVPADYDGDGKADLATFECSVDLCNLWYIQYSSDSSGGYDRIHWAHVPNKMIPAPGDYNGDKRADLAAFDPKTGKWIIRNSGALWVDDPFAPDNQDAIETTVTYGTDGDYPAPGDYDADGRTDVAVWRPSNGTWYIRLSSDVIAGLEGTNERTVVFGIAGDRPMPLPTVIFEWAYIARV